MLSGVVWAAIGAVIAVGVAAGVYFTIYPHPGANAATRTSSLPGASNMAASNSTGQSTSGNLIGGSSNQHTNATASGGNPNPPGTASNQHNNLR